MDPITHHYENYARISPSDMAENDEIIRASYNAEEPLESLIESLIESLNKCVNFATAYSKPVL